MKSPRRRTVLAALATTAASTVSGCTGLLSEDEPDDTGDENETNATTEDAETGDSETDDSETDDEERDGEGEPETPTDAATRFVEDLAAGAFERANERVAPAGQADLPPGELELIWMGFTAIGGEFEAIVGTNETIEQGYDAIELTMDFEGGTHHVEVWIDGDLNVVGVFFDGEYERPSYVDPDSFTEAELTVPAEDCPLPATVTLPETADDVPGIVLVHGTGPADRDLTNGATKAFKDLAEGLATRGVATLRYDKRTARCEPDLDDFTLDRVTVDDALVAIEELRDVDGVDPDEIVVVGLSQGGMALPRIADRDGRLAGGVALAAPARSFVELSLDQNEHLATVGEYEHQTLQDDLERVETEIERIRAGEYEPDDVLLELPGAFWDSLEEYDQVETARELDLPLLFCQGERDYQVTVEGDFERWQTELDDRPATEFGLYDELNHLFMPGEGPSVTYEYFPRNNVDERIVEDVADWILER